MAIISITVYIAGLADATQSKGCAEFKTKQIQKIKAPSRQRWDWAGLLKPDCRLLITVRKINFVFPFSVLTKFRFPHFPHPRAGSALKLKYNLSPGSREREGNYDSELQRIS
jgi:hypothetical protein